MNLQEHIRKVLREETQKLSIFLLRRMDFNEVKNILDKQIEEQRYLLSQLNYKSLRDHIFVPNSVKHTVDAIFRKTTRKVLPVDIYRIHSDEIQDYLRAEYYDYVFNKIKEYHLYYLKQEYKNK